MQFLASSSFSRSIYSQSRALRRPAKIDRATSNWQNQPGQAQIQQMGIGAAGTNGEVRLVDTMLRCTLKKSTSPENIWKLPYVFCLGIVWRCLMSWTSNLGLSETQIYIYISFLGEFSLMIHLQYQSNKTVAARWSRPAPWQKIPRPKRDLWLFETSLELWLVRRIIPKWSLRWMIPLSTNHNSS